MSKDEQQFEEDVESLEAVQKMKNKAKKRDEKKRQDMPVSGKDVFKLKKLKHKRDKEDKKGEEGKREKEDEQDSRKYKGKDKN